MHPYYNGFTGDIVADQTKAGNYTCTGKIQRIDDTTLEITELPLKVWTQDYKEFLEKMLVGDKEKKIESEILDFKENHTDDTVAFTVYAAKEKIDEFEQSKMGLLGKFKLTSTFTTSNMNLFDASSRITKFGTPEEILDAFYVVRLEFYSKRKALLLKNLRHEQLVLSNKARFVEEVCKGDLIISNRKRADILADLQRRGYDLIEKNKKSSGEEEDDELIDEETSDAKLIKGYDYLLGMKIWNLTMEKVLQLQRELDEKVRAVDELDKRSITDIWLEDLRAIESALEEREFEKAAQLGEERKAQLKSQNFQKQRGKKGPVKPNQKKKVVIMKSKDASYDSSIELSDSDEDYTASLKKPLKQNVLQKKDSGAVLKIDDTEQKLSCSFAKPTDEMKFVTNLKKGIEEVPEIQYTENLSNASAAPSKGKAKKRPSPKEFAVEDEFDFESSSSGNMRSKVVEAKKIRRGGVKPKNKKEKPKKAAAVQRQEILVDTSGSERECIPQTSTRPQRSRVAAAKVNYVVDLLDTTDEDNESDYE